MLDSLPLIDLSLLKCDPLLRLWDHFWHFNSQVYKLLLLGLLIHQIAQLLVPWQNSALQLARWQVLFGGPLQNLIGDQDEAVDEGVNF